LWNNKVEKFLQQYVNIGFRLNNYQMDKVFTNNSLKNTYLRQRLIANEHTNDLSRKEFDQISPENQQKIKNKLLAKPAEDAISQAASQGFTDIVKLLIDKVNNLPNAAKVLEFAMRRAAENGHKDTVELLIDKVSNIDWAVAAAAANGHKDVLEFLLDKGSTNNLEAATHMAVVNNHKDIFELLISKGVKDFRYMIKLAAQRGYKDIIKLMLQHGNLTKYDLIDAKDIAKNTGHIDVVNLLVSAIH
jgi:ankyrin repeat protein